MSDLPSWLPNRPARKTMGSLLLDAGNDLLFVGADSHETFHDGAFADGLADHVGKAALAVTAWIYISALERGTRAMICLVVGFHLSHLSELLL